MARNLTNIPPGNTTCTVCGSIKPNTEFSYYLTRITSDGFRLRTNTNCIVCQSIRAKMSRKVAKQYAHLKPEASESCQCCGRVPINGKWEPDHDAETGEFRGWICKDCNVGFGKLGDTYRGLLKGLLFLLKHKSAEARAVCIESIRGL